MRRPPSSRLVPYAATALVLYVACGPGAEVPRIDDDFSELCEGAPCHWTTVEGEPSQARLVEGFHPGTYALRLEGAVSVRRDVRSASRIIDRSRVQLELALRCDQRETMMATLTFTADGVDDGGDLLEPRVVSSSADIDAGWQRALFTFEADTGDMRSFTIVKRGISSCDLGYVHVSTTRLPGAC